MTIFGVDVSEWQNGMSLQQASREGIDFFIIRTNDGSYADKVTRSHIDDAKATGKPISAYWFLRNPAEGSSIQAQADVCARQLAGTGITGVWLDCETEFGLHESHIQQARDALIQRGLRCIGIYTGRYYWEGRVAPHEPKMAQFGALWKAGYPVNSRGGYRAIYPGDGHPYWDYPLGDQLPVMWQYASVGEVAGHAVDVNAFKGSVEQVRALFDGGEVPAPEPTPAPEPVKKGLNPMELVKNLLAVIVTQLVGAGRDPNGNPTYDGFSTDFVYANAKRKQFKKLTLMEAVIVNLAETRALHDRIDALEKKEAK